MNKTVKLIRIGDNFGFTVPKELIEKYNLKEDQELHIIEANKGFTLTPFNPDFERWADAFDKTNSKFRNTLKEIAK